MTLPTWFARVRWIVLLPVALFLGLGAWALASPIGASPDDDFHLASIWCAGGDRAGLCAPGDTPIERTVDSSLVTAACFAYEPTVSAGCQDSLGLFQADTPTVSTDRGSFSSNYPPVFYAVMNWFATPDIELSAMIMRFVNILFFIGSGIALWFLLARENRRTLLLMWAVTTVPLGLSLIASNNPSSWAITGVPTAWFALYGFLKKPESTNADGRRENEWSRRRIALAAVFAVEAFLASGARGDAALYTIIGSAVAVALTWRRSRDYAYALVVPAVLAVVSALFFLLSGQSAVAAQGLSSSETSEIVAQNPRTGLGVLAVNIAQLPFLWVGAFGSWGLGWLDTEMPAIVWAAAAGVAVGILFFALGKSSRTRAWTAAAIGGLTALIPLYVLQRSLSYVGEQVQPRYILPLMILCAGVLLLSLERSDVSLTRPQGLLAALALSAASAMALFVNIKRYVAGINTASGVNLNGDMQWWWAMPVTPMVVWAIGSLALAGVFLSVFHIAHTRR
jgi:hypothetical protein